ncbi:MAG: Gfo/Idh/MocA family oxidoreductase [Acidobacteriota bacterium]|nr:Gfo/Idh/MocA family oxidoreductase [Blastocatellia bacterium]MDW8239000.1 Gfo/Idh/MocA family oxidoreductase [Acidobacteriota bacterium]
MTAIKIGIVGAGYIGNVHAKILSRDERVRLTAVYDLVPERAQACADAYGARAVQSVEALIEMVDAVYVTTPNTQHVDIALKAIAARRHVFCEKPLATSLDEARCLLQASRQHRQVFQVGHNRRFAPVYQHVKRLIGQAPLRPHSVHAKMNRGELLNPAWTGDPSVTGGYLYETPVHIFDMLRWLFGDVESMIVHATSHEYPEMDDFSLLLRFRSGLHATLATAADASWHFPFERLEVFCHHATIETQQMERVLYTASLDAQTITHGFEHLDKEERWGYIQEDRAFVDAIIGGHEAPVTALDGYKAVELVDACYRAARTGERVQLAA